MHVPVSMLGQNSSKVRSQECAKAIWFFGFVSLPPLKGLLLQSTSIATQPLAPSLSNYKGRSVHISCTACGVGKPHQMPCTELVTLGGH